MKSEWLFTSACSYAELGMASSRKHKHATALNEIKTDLTSFPIQIDSLFLVSVLCSLPRWLWHRETERKYIHELMPCHEMLVQLIWYGFHLLIFKLNCLLVWLASAIYVCNVRAQRQKLCFVRTVSMLMLEPFILRHTCGSCFNTNYLRHCYWLLQANKIRFNAHTCTI